MKNKRETALKWFIDFINLKPDKLSPGDRVKLAVELELALGGGGLVTTPKSKNRFG